MCVCIVDIMLQIFFVCFLKNFSLQYDVDNEKIELRKTKNQIDYQRNETKKLMIENRLIFCTNQSHNK